MMQKSRVNLMHVLTAKPSLQMYVLCKHQTDVFRVKHFGPLSKYKLAWRGQFAAQSPR